MGNNQEQPLNLGAAPVFLWVPPDSGGFISGGSSLETGGGALNEAAAPLHRNNSVEVSHPIRTCPGLFGVLFVRAETTRQTQNSLESFYVRSGLGTDLD